MSLFLYTHIKTNKKEWRKHNEKLYEQRKKQGKWYGNQDADDESQCEECSLQRAWRKLCRQWCLFLISVSLYKCTRYKAQQ